MPLPGRTRPSATRPTSLQWGEDGHWREPKYDCHLSGGLQLPEFFPVPAKASLFGSKNLPVPCGQGNRPQGAESAVRKNARQARKTGEVILAAIGRVKAANPDARYCCDPVIGNRARGEFVRPGIAAFMRERAVPAAQVVTPNHFELDRLAGRETRSLADILSAIDHIHSRGPRAVLVTSVRSDATPDGSLDIIASDSNGRHLVRTPRLATPANGAGDLIAALFFLHYLRGGVAPEALARATSSVFGLLRRTRDAGASEIALIAAQDELATPSETFTPVRIGL